MIDVYSEVAPNFKSAIIHRDVVGPYEMEHDYGLIGGNIFHGELSLEAHKKRAMELGLHSANMPKELGGGGCTSLQQVLVQEQMGRVTNALGWVAATPPSWLTRWPDAVA